MDCYPDLIHLDQLREILIPQQDFKPFPKTDDREAWARVPSGVKEDFIHRAEGYLDFKWEPLPATLVLEYVRNGNRSNYEAISFGKRKALGTLLIAEILEDQGRFTDQIMNGVWSICEESYWGVTAHIGGQHAGPGLPDVADPYVDLFAAETATFLTLTDYFVGEKLDAISPLVRERIQYEVNLRIFTPVMSWTHGGWAPGEKARRPNNWNPWICSNWLMSALLLEQDEERRVSMVRKILVVIDEFLDAIPEDGGCDEGPGYWNVAAASLFDNLSILDVASAVRSMCMTIRR